LAAAAADSTNKGLSGEKETAMVELTEISEARQKIQELKEKMLVLKEHL
jgi:hypothetical protein